MERSAPLLRDFDGDGDLDLLVGSADHGILFVENAGTPEAAVFGVDASGYAKASRVELLGVGDSEHLVLGDGFLGDRSVVVVGDGAGGIRFALPFDEDALVAVDAYPSPLRDVDAAGYAARSGFDGLRAPAPALADLTGDGIDDLVVGGAYGSLAFFDGSAAAAGADAGGEEL